VRTSRPTLATIQAKAPLAALALVAVGSVLSTAVFSIGLACTFLLWAIFSYWRNGALRSWITGGAMLFLFGLCAAALAAQDSAAAWDEVRKYYPVVLLVFAQDIVRSRQELFWIARPFLISAVVVAAIAPLASLGIAQWHESMVGGSFRYSGNAGILQYAICMVFAWVICLWIFLQTKNLRLVAGALVGLVLFAQAILANGSRASLVAISFALALIAWSRYCKRKRLLILLAPLLLGIPLVMDSGLGDRLSNSNDEFNLDDPTSQRQALWAYAWAVFLDAPVLGAGPGSFATASAELKTDPRLAKYPHLNEIHQTAHNIFLHILATAGVVGLLGLLSWLGITTWVFLRAYLHGSDLAVPALACWLAFLAFSLTDMPILNTRINGLVFLALGASAGSIRGSREACDNP
jgi:O-antigen ligase